MTEPLFVDTAGGVATITLNRPERLNAIDADLLEALVSALESAADDDRARVVVVAGAGRSFCAGADISQMQEREAADWEAIVDRYLDPVRAIARMDKPVIARCQGDVVGGGLGIAMACDFRVGADDSRYRAPFVLLALAGCDMSAGYFLPRLVGLGRATDMMMTGRFVEAEEALRIGLVSRVVPREELDSAVAGLAGDLAKGAPRALAYTKRAIRKSLDRTMDAEFDYEIFAQVQCLQSEDHREGITAFREKRSPDFRGK